MVSIWCNLIKRDCFSIFYRMQYNDWLSTMSTTDNDNRYSGTKFVLKKADTVRKQLLIMSGTPILAFVTKGFWLQFNHFPISVANTVLCYRWIQMDKRLKKIKSFRNKVCCLQLLHRGHHAGWLQGMLVVLTLSWGLNACQDALGHLFREEVLIGLFLWEW